MINNYIILVELAVRRAEPVDLALLVPVLVDLSDPVFQTLHLPKFKL